MKNTNNRKQIEGSILAAGEHTNHHHRVTVPVYEGPENTREFDGPTTVTHEEHGPITIPAKEMASGQVQEFDYLAKMKRPVQD